MLLLEGKNLSQHYGDKTIFSDLNLAISDHSKIGLIGTNGSGKSTLLKILAGIKTADKGKITTSNQLIMEYLSQELFEDSEKTIIEAIFHGTSPIFETVRAYDKALLNLEENTPEAHEAFNEASEAMDRVDAWAVESKARAILSKLGLSDTKKLMCHLSGGEKKKVAIASALIRPSNLLLLDEPTNHLDYDTIIWLEKELKERGSALVLITHDRYFLDRVCNEIIELEAGKLYHYKGNYSYYLEEKTNRLAIENEMARKKERLYKKELLWMKKGVEARRTKQKARIERFYTLEESMKIKREDKLVLDFGSARLGKKIIEIENLTKKRGDKLIFKDFSYTFTKGDAIGILGKNGSGKSTLFDILAGLDSNYSGKVDFGETLAIGYYRQHNLELPLQMKVIDYIKEHGEYIERKDGSRISASKMLELFLFSPSLKHSEIRYLSGGEKRRLYLLAILMSRVNMLILDEPTNDLDIPTIQVLEDFLDHFPGPILVASHDRYFIDRVVNKLFLLENQKISLMRGDFSTYLENRPKEVTEKRKHQKEKKEKPILKEKPLKLTWKEEKDYENIGFELTFLEESINRVDKLMLENATNSAKLVNLQKEKDSLEEALEEKMSYWLILEEKIALIEAQKEQ